MMAPPRARETLEQRIAALLPAADIVLPDGEGPFPVVVQLHGCGGKKRVQAHWANEAKKAGWAALVIDSYAHRNISTFQAYATVCTGLRLRGRERAGDLFAAMAWLRRQPWAEAARIAVAGWSHGGWTALDAMALSPGEDVAASTRLAGLSDEPLAGLVGAFVVYPYVGPGSIARTRGLRIDAPVRALVGTNDIVVGNKSAARTLKRMPTRGAPVEVVMLEGATHAFDEPDANDLRVRYDPGLVELAHRHYRDFLTSL